MHTICGDKGPIPFAKADLHPKKVLLPIWWDWKGVLQATSTKPVCQLLKKPAFNLMNWRQQ